MFMKPRFLIITCSILWLAASLYANSDANTPTPQQIHEELKAIRALLEQQENKVNRLWRIAQPYLAELEAKADQEEKQRKEDMALKMQEVLRRTNILFTSKLMFVPCSHTVMLAYSDNTIRFFDVNTAEEVNKSVRLDSIAKCLAVTADGATLFAGTDKGFVYAWKNGSDACKEIFDTNGWSVDSLAVSPDGTRLAWATNGGYGTNSQWKEPNESCCVINLKNNKKIFGFSAGRSDFQGVSFSTDSRVLALVKNSCVDLIDANTGKVIRSLEAEAYSCGPLSVVCGPTENLVAIGYAPYHIGLWNAATGMMTKLLAAHDNWVVSLCVSPDGIRLVSSAGDSTASVWDIKSGTEIGRIRFGEGDSYVRSVSISSDGQLLAIGRNKEWVICRMPCVMPAQ
jgi:WD40 repeat protein